ncbi:MAG TPA: glycosyltransferase [Gaiellaceae bacterium]|nr:glycosyltransferase [Gaiellaceae bacterium]
MNGSAPIAEPAPQEARTKIAIFAPSMAGGGAERGAVKLAEGLVRRGFDVDLVLATAEGPRLGEIPSEVRVVDLGGRRVLGSLPRLTRYLRREKPRGLASVLDHANVVALWARKLAGYSGRVVVIEQNTLSEAARNGKSRRDRMMPRLARRFYPWADYVVGVSEGVSEDLAQFVSLPAEKLRVIPNPIVAPEIEELARAPVDHAWIDGSAPVLVAAGRLRAQKDFPTLLRAFSLVRAKRPVRLLILGEGPERERLETLTRELELTSDVSLPGATTNPYAYMARATAFVLSSRWEGLPTVLIEAMSCGAPVVATDCPSGPREILADGRYGALVPVGDVQALAAAMEDALDGKLAPPPVESWRRYSIDAVVDEYIPLLVAS